MKEIDALGLACPMPVLLTKREIDAGESLIVTKVDNAAAVGNLMRLGESLGYSANVEEEGGVFKVMLAGSAGGQAGETAQKKAGPNSTKPQATARKTGDTGEGLCSCELGGWAVLVAGESLGRGSDELGETLMTMFFYTLSQGEDIPAYILFLNGGVKVPTENTEAAGHLKVLAERGCEILSCGTCLNYLNLKDQLQVGEVSNMYEILSRLQKATKVISL